MHIELTQQQKDKQKEFKDFVNSEIAPFADQYDENEKFPIDIIKKLNKKGYLSAIIPTQYGGTEFEYITFGLLCEEIGRASFSLASMLTVHGMISTALLKWGTKDQKDKWLPKLAKGELLGAFALSEPDIGSDPKHVKTIATIESDNYILNGKKKWISCGQCADLFLVIAQCEEKPTAFIVNKSTPGFSISPIKGLLGFRSAMLAELTFDNCKIPKENLLGKIGFGFSHVCGTALDHGRYCIAWGCVGLAQAALEASLDYTNKREQFGVLLKKHQLIQQMIANMATDISAARMLCFKAGHLKKTGDPGVIMETSMAKYFASKMAYKVASDAVQIHGANGCSSEYPVQRYLRDAKVTEIIEGSSQIQQIIISQHAYHQHQMASMNF